jgi:starvation-inducible outer membrane lipoprotein
MYFESIWALLQQVRLSHHDRRVLACLLVGALLPACAPAPIFPPDVRDKPDRTVTFESLVANPDQYQNRTVELGGQIVGSITEQDEVQMLVRDLPIRTTPVYGPVDTGRLNGMFVIRYRGKIGAQDLQDGNMVVVIGAVMGAVASSLTGTPVRRLTVTAECFHIWRTQGNPIEDFPWTMNARWWPLIQQTYCVNRPNIILPVS